MKEITPSDIEIIKNAKVALEGDSVALRLNAYVSKGVNLIVTSLPDSFQNQISRAVNASLTKATDWAFLTTGSKECPVLRKDWMHKAGVVASGAIGGLGGITTAAWELPVSTMIMLRSIGCIAEEEGLSMRDPKTRLGCISVLAMGADAKNVKGEELGYWVARNSMAGLVTQALEWNGRSAAPALTQFIMKTAERFGVVVSEKLALQAVPALGAAAGAGINHFFLDHYQKVAHAHFSLERLCLIYEEKPVKAAYARL